MRATAATVSASALLILVAGFSAGRVGAAKTEPGAGNGSLFLGEETDPYAELPLGKPEEASLPPLGATGSSDASIHTKAADVVPGRQSGQPESWDLPKRKVQGAVYEVRDGMRIPLSGVVLTDWQSRHMTVTDGKGHFAFEAYFHDEPAEEQDPDEFYEEQDEEGDDDPSNDEVYLQPLNVGYRSLQGWGGSWFRGDALNREDGVQLYIERAKPIDVEVQLRNPPDDPTTLTYFLDCRGYRRSGATDLGGFAIAVCPDDKGKAVFSIPSGVSYDLFAVGPGVRSMRKVRPVSDKPARQVREMKLEPCTSILLAGTISDRRTGAPLGGVLLAGPPGEFRVNRAVSSADGKFRLYMESPIEGKPRNIEVEYSSYEGGQFLESLFEEQRLSQTDSVASQDKKGKWQVKLNPLVFVVFDVPVDALKAKPGDTLLVRRGSQRHRVIVPEDGEVQVGPLPWKCDAISLGVEQEHGYADWLQFKIEPETWPKEPPYKLKLVQTNGD
ncbi:MAG: hypothetical protein H6839_07600 [Planctomycetes bacterium]|nr:hypothetical protein [Planctomycetota bacterium]